MSDYIAEIKIKNGPMLRAMRKRGITSAAQLARLAGCHLSDACEHLSLKKPALKKNGDYFPSIIKIAEALKTMPCDLFPPQHYERPLKISSGEIELSLDDVRQLAASATPEQLLLDSGDKKLLGSFIERLPKKQKQTIIARLEGKTFDEIAGPLNVCRARAREIAMKAERTMRRRARVEQQREDLEVLIPPVEKEMNDGKRF